MKNLTYALLVLVLVSVGAAVVYAAPTSRLERTLIPELNSTYYLGTTSPSVIGWAGVVTDRLCLTADICRTTWPSGASGTISSSTALVSGQVDFSTSASTIGNDANFYWDNVNKRLGIGTSTPAVNLDIAGDGSLNVDLTRSSDTTAGPSVRQKKTRGTGAAPTIVQNGDTLGSNTFFGWDGAAFTNGARIRSVVDNTPSASVMPAAILFETATGASLLERARITSTGNLGIGTTTPTHLVEAYGGSFFQSPSQSTVATSASINGNGTNKIQAATGAGKFLYEVDNGGNFFIYNVATSTPDLVSSLNASGANTLRGVAVAGNYAYVVGDGTAGLTVVDISNKALPVVVANITSITNTRAVAVSGKYVYMLRNNATGLLIYDVSNPAAPVSVGSAAVAAAAAGSTVVVQGRYAYISGVSTNMLIYDISNPATPSLVSTTGLGASGNGLDVQGTIAYVATASTTAAIQIYNVGNPATPALLSTVNPSAATAVIGSGMYLYSFGANSMNIWNVFTPAAPYLVATPLAANGSELGSALLGTKVYFATNSGGGKQVDITGLNVPAANIDSLQASNIQVLGSGSILNQLSVGSLNVATNAIVNGTLSITGTASSTFTNGAALVVPIGNIGFGTTTPWGLLSVNANGLAAGVPQFVVGSSTGTNLIVSNSGNVGIGLTNPTSRLEVQGVTADSTSNAFIAWNSALTNVFNIRDDGNIGVGTSSPFAKLSVMVGGTYASQAASTAFAVGSSTAGTATSTLFTILSNGNVGIGTAAPSTPLYLTTSAAQVATFESSGTIETNVLQTTAAAAITNIARQQFSAMSSTQLRPISRFDASFKDITDATRTGHFGIFNAASATFIERFSIDGANIGIGTTTPGSMLSIAGSAGGTTSLFMLSTSTAGFATTTAYKIDSNGNQFITGGADLTVSHWGVPAGSFAAFDPNGKLIATTTPSGGSGTVTSIATNNGLTGGTITTTGTIGLAAIAANSVLGNITGASAVPTAIATSSLFLNASGSTSGLLTSTDWTTFNGKQNLLLGTTGQLAYFSGTNTAVGTSTLFITPSATIGIATTTTTYGSSSWTAAISNALTGIGGLLINTATNVANALTIKNAAGIDVFNVDTTATSPFLGVGSTYSTSANFSVGSTTATVGFPSFEIDTTGHVVTSGQKPVVSSCGTTNTISGNDVNGTISLTGTLVTSCTMTFATAVPAGQTVDCTATGNSGASFAYISATSTTAITFGLSASVSTDSITYNCPRHQ